MSFPSIPLFASSPLVLGFPSGFYTEVQGSLQQQWRDLDTSLCSDAAINLRASTTQKVPVAVLGSKVALLLSSVDSEGLVDPIQEAAL